MLKKVLVANRGEIALRVMRACRECGIDSVAVYSEVDRAALHVRAADEAFEIGPASPSESYLSIERLLHAAKLSGADAVHPGYGFLAENACFAEAVQAAGLVWIGPGPDAIRRMGDKVEARRTMESAGVPVVPGTHEAAVDSEVMLEAARGMGFPVMVKAAGGGGGKGIRIVDREADLLSNVERARSEAKTGFGNDAVYLEKYLTRARHIEIQVFADNHGNAVHLGERECSMQRRHQKILEECPSVAVTEELRQAMGAAAVQAALAVNYVGAGTVEFLVDAESNFYFLEMNTRLQVEHPITEMVTGVDLVREQLLVAAGEPLSLGQQDVRMRGHAIEARICAEEPERGFLPAIGVVQSLELPGGGGVRFDSGLYAGMEISVYYDPMLAKLVVHAPDRKTAIRRMSRALKELKITGVATNVSFLRALTESELFQSGDYHTASVEQHFEDLLGVDDEESLKRIALVAAVLHRQMATHRSWSASDRSASERAAGGWLMQGRRDRLERWRP